MIEYLPFMKMEGDIICIHCGILKSSPVVDSGDETCNYSNLRRTMSWKVQYKAHVKLFIEYEVVFMSLHLIGWMFFAL